MADQILNTYFVGDGQPYETANQAIDAIANALLGGDFVLPSDELPDGGQINVILRGNALHAPVKIPDSVTPILIDHDRYLIIRRLELQENGKPIKDELPIISPEAPTAKDLDIQDRLIGIDLGHNNPNVKVKGLRVEKFLIGVRAGFSCHNFYLDRNFITNCLNTGVYVHDLENLYATNNLIIGGQYGFVARYIKAARIYHNTVFLDGVHIYGEGTKAGFMLQGERLFNNTASTLYCLGNIVYTIGCPAAVFYDEDLKNQRLISNYNDFYSVDQPLVQLRQDSAQVGDEDEVVDSNYFNLKDWSNAGQLGDVVDENGLPVGIDSHSISMHPIFINNINTANSNFSIIDLTLIQNSPLLAKVPSWWFDSTPDPKYIPSDFDESIIAVDSLLNPRESPFTAIGANDAASVNGFFGQDIFTSPFAQDPAKKCNADPFVGITKQSVDMLYPEITAGYFYSHERQYYLYAKKGAYQLGYLAQSHFTLPGRLDFGKALTVKARGKDVPVEDWDVIGDQLIISHRENGISDWNDEIEVEGYILKWGDVGFSSVKALYVFKVRDGVTKYVMPKNFKPSGPIVITDDRVAYTDPIELTRQSFHVTFDPDRQETIFGFNTTKNMIENPQFDQSPNGFAPSYWQTRTGSNTFLLASPWAYIGEQALGLSIGDDAGHITSNTFPVKSGDPLSISWHSSLPLYMTGDAGDFTGEVGSIYVNFYDHMDNVVQSDEVTFDIVSEDFRRHYIVYGPDDLDVEANLFQSNVFMTGALEGVSTFPIEASYAKVAFEAPTRTDVVSGAFMVLDAVQVEKHNVPTAYHQQPDLKNMTVEFETSEEETFVDKRMNISPVFNENPNGFLYIIDMPARIWGGPDNIETTTLHEYRWPEGRLFHLPWSRTWGKDKMVHRVAYSEEPLPPVDVIELIEVPKTAVEAQMAPTILISRQDTKFPEGLLIQVLDKLENPYSLRNYTLTVLDPHDNFPGYLSKRKFGAKEQLGTTVFGSLSEHGSANAFYVPPPSTLVRYIGDIPQVEQKDPNYSGFTDSISFIKTNYDVNLENNGNITIIGISGYIATESTCPISGEYIVETDNQNGAFVSLEYPPVVGSVNVVRNHVRLEETFGEPQNNEFGVDYPNAQIIFYDHIEPDIPIEILYNPKYAYPDPANQNTIIFHHDRVFGSYSGPIQVDYDAQLYLEINVQQIVTGEFTNTFPVVAQNPKLGEFTNNPLSLEY